MKQVLGLVALVALFSTGCNRQIKDFVGSERRPGREEVVVPDPKSVVGWVRVSSGQSTSSGASVQSVHVLGSNQVVAESPSFTGVVRVNQSPVWMQ